MPALLVLTDQFLHPSKKRQIQFESISRLENDDSWFWSRAQIRPRPTRGPAKQAFEEAVRQKSRLHKHQYI